MPSTSKVTALQLLDGNCPRSSFPPYFITHQPAAPSMTQSFTHPTSHQQFNPIQTYEPSLVHWILFPSSQERRLVFYRFDFHFHGSAKSLCSLDSLSVIPCLTFLFRQISTRFFRSAYFFAFIFHWDQLTNVGPLNRYLLST